MKILDCTQNIFKEKMKKMLIQLNSTKMNIFIMTEHALGGNASHHNIIQMSDNIGNQNVEKASINSYSEVIQ
jgi:hypothetical protein